jgi:hypothetical protein
MDSSFLLLFLSIYRHYRYLLLFSTLSGTLAASFYAALMALHLFRTYCKETSERFALRTAPSTNNENELNTLKYCFGVAAR